jgi:CheY-like chemotaxis protein
MLPSFAESATCLANPRLSALTQTGTDLVLNPPSITLTACGLHFCKLEGIALLTNIKFIIPGKRRDRVPRVQLLIAVQNPVMRQTLLELVQEHYDVVAIVGEGKSVLKEIEATRPDVVLLGVAFYGVSGFEVARRLRQSRARTRIILLSLHESQEMVRAAIAVGISGYVFISRLLDDLPAAIDAVSHGQIFEPTE